MGYNNMDSASKINLDTDYGDGDKLYVSSSYESLFSILIILLLPLTTYYLELEQSYHACEMFCGKENLQTHQLNIQSTVFSNTGFF